MTNRCDRVVGGPGTRNKKMHCCDRKAVVRSYRKIGITDGVMSLDYCKQHRGQAYKTDSSIVRIVEVVSLVSE